MEPGVGLKCYARRRSWEWFCHLMRAIQYTVIHVSHGMRQWKLYAGESGFCDISSSPGLRSQAFIKLLFLLLRRLPSSSSINPEKLSPSFLILMKLSQNLSDFHHECEWNGFLVVSVSMRMSGWKKRDYKGISWYQAFFNSYRLCVPFVLLIGGSAKWDDDDDEVSQPRGWAFGERPRNLIVWWFGKLT